MSIRPISPNQLHTIKKKTTREIVYETVNEMLVENAGDRSRIILKLEDILMKLVARGLDKYELIDKGFMDFEPAYRKAGWKVDYDEPGWNETYPATYTFSKR